MKHAFASLFAAAMVLTLTPRLFARDSGIRDTLRVEEVSRANGIAVFRVHVQHDQRLTAFDIPLRFGRPGDSIELASVAFAERVGHWDYKHAQIDNQHKTVILGLVAVVGRIEPDDDLDIPSGISTGIADLSFNVGSAQEIILAPFTTREPDHDLTFLYYRYESDMAYVESYSPEFTASTIALKPSAIVPDAFQLSRNSPNPFNASTRFSLTLAEASRFSIVIYNLAGQRVKTYEGQLSAGAHFFTWDGLTDQGHPAASGVYFYRATIADDQATRMMMLLK